MATVAATPSVVQDIVDDREEREMWIVGKEMERPPYFIEGKGGDLRLAKALRVVQEGRIVPNSDGSFTVTGSENREYRVAESCSCPQSQKGRSRWCYHAVAAALFVEWRKRCASLGTPTLPLPPTTVDERLGAIPQTYGARQAVKALGPHPAASPATPFVLNLPEDGWVAVAPDGTPTPVTSTPAQEVLMTEDADAYIPEPEAPVAVLEAPVPTKALTPRTAPDDDLEAALTTWTAQRAIVQRFLKQELKPNIDYYTLKIGGRESKPSLSKAGAEKVMGWLKIQASFAPDTGTWEMLGRPQDMVLYICTLRTRSGEIVGEGRGARSIKKDNGDVNKAIKMAEKSACVSAVLRTGALSDVFTCDVEDMQEEKETPATSNTKPASAAEVRAQIWAIVQQRAPEVRTREAVEAWVKERTGFALHPDNYGVIHTRLQDG